MKKIMICLFLVLIMVAPMLAGCGGGSSEDDSNSSSDSSSDSYSALNSSSSGTYDLVFSDYSSSYTESSTSVTTSSGSHTVKYKVYSNIVYVSDPVDYKYESMNVFVPYEIDGISVSTSNAPILFSIGVGGYMSSSVWGSGSADTNGNGGRALAAGYVVVSVGCRGRDNSSSTAGYYGKAPAAMVDLKAAVRYMRYNSGTFPGNVEQIISSGGSAGGALSALLGASGNSSLYDSDLTALGAADAGDNIFAVGAWSPITNLDHADMSYEWEYGSASYNGSEVDQALSGELLDLFETYQDGLALTGHDGSTITAGNINAYLLESYLIPSANKYMSALSSSALSGYLSSHTWITWNSSNSIASFSFSDYVNYIGRGKSVPAFDAFGLSSPECILFGDSTTNARHFTNFSLQNASGDSSAAISNDLQTIVNMMNPMYFIDLQNSGCAEYWWIRDGAKATDTSAIVIIDLATSLENLLGASHVNAWEDWDAGHNVNQDPDGFITWIAGITGYSL